MKLYTYWRSSAAYRVRIALNLKGIEAELIPVHLVKDGGQQHAPDYTALNPQHLVPTFTDGDTVLTQSLAIVEYLDERQPEPALLPESAADRAWVRSLAQVIACDIHPIDNLRVLQYLAQELQVGDDAKKAWYRHWVIKGFDALEAMLANDERTGTFCYGARPGLADLCLVPQVYNARRFDIDLTPYPTIARIDAACQKLAAFKIAAPENQPDAG